MVIQPIRQQRRPTSRVLTRVAALCVRNGLPTSCMLGILTTHFIRVIYLKDSSTRRRDTLRTSHDPLSIGCRTRPAFRFFSSARAGVTPRIKNLRGKGKLGDGVSRAFRGRGSTRVAQDAYPGRSPRAVNAEKSLGPEQRHLVKPLLLDSQDPLR